MKAIFLSLLLSGLVAFPARAMDSQALWAEEFDKAMAEGLGLDPGAAGLAPLAWELAREIAAQELKGMAPARAAVVAFGLATDLDLDLRTGWGLQDAKARSIQVARLVLRDSGRGRHSGIEALKRMRARQERSLGSLRAGALADPFRLGWSTRPKSGSGPK